MRKRFILAALALSSTPFAAQAADLGPAPAYRPNIAISSVYNWTGFYVGADLGYGRGSSPATLDPDFGFSATANPNGFVGGLQLGYDWQMSNRFVFGVQLNANWANFKGTGTQDFLLLGILPGTTTYSAKLDYYVAAEARAGYLLNQNLMLYVLGGVAMGHVSQTGDISFLATSVASMSESSNEFGWVAGLGAEWKVDSRWSLNAQYKHIDFGSFDGKLQVGATQYPTTAKLDVDIFTVGIKYSF